MQKQNATTGGPWDWNGKTKRNGQYPVLARSKEQGAPLIGCLWKCKETQKLQKTIGNGYQKS